MFVVPPYAIGRFALGLLLPAALTREPLTASARWWDLGHRVVARLAEARLTPHTQAAVRDILGGQSLADASVWADNIRQYRHDADKLHYVNIPLADTVYLQRVREDIEGATRSGVRATPTFFLNSVIADVSGGMQRLFEGVETNLQQ